MENTISLRCRKEKQTRTFGFQHVEGEIIDIQETTKTSISSTKSYVNDGPLPTPVVNSVSGTSTQIQTIFVRTTEGKEIDLRLINQPIALRVGNKISAIYLEETSDGGRVLVGIVNHDSGKAVTFGEFDQGKSSILLNSMGVKPNSEWPDALILIGLVGVGIIWGLEHSGGMAFAAAFGGVFLSLPAMIVRHAIAGKETRAVNKKAEKLRSQLLDQVVSKGFTGSTAGA